MFWRKKKGIPVKVYFIKTKDTWVSEECVLNEREKKIDCNGKEIPLMSVYKVVNEDIYVQIMCSPVKSVKINEDGTYTLIEDPSTIEESVMKGLQRALEKPPIWWQWLMLLLFGAFGGIGLGIFISLFFMPKSPGGITVVRP